MDPSGRSSLAQHHRTVVGLSNLDLSWHPTTANSEDPLCAGRFYLFPLARLCVLQSIWQFEATVAPPLTHGVTWSASMSAKGHILVLFASWPRTQRGQLDSPFSFALVVCFSYAERLVATSNTRTLRSFVSIEPPSPKPSVDSTLEPRVDSEKPYSQGPLDPPGVSACWQGSVLG